MRKDTPLGAHIRLRPIAPHERKYTALERLVDLYSNQQVSYGWVQALAIWARRKLGVRLGFKAGVICSELAAMYANHLGENVDVNDIAPDGLLIYLERKAALTWDREEAEYSRQ